MIRVYQSDNESCFRAAVASVLEMNIIHVPDLHGCLDWRGDFARWCVTVGYRCTFHYRERKTRNGIYIAVGHSPRNRDHMHAVVHHGLEIVHDPHPECIGIVDWEYSIELTRLAP